ncbi:MAG: AAA family ATPase [Methanobacterium sp.]|nr:AAA family ATPase [Methanobacterium sp.]
MSLIITVANEKGGVGKTTTAVELALQAIAGGHKACIVDTDHQQSCVKFKMRREQLAGDVAKLKVLPLVGKSVGLQIRELAGDFDVLVVDAGGRDSQEMRLAMLTSHLVVIPTSAKSLETDGLNKMASLINEVRLQNPALAAVILPTRLGASSHSADRQIIIDECRRPIDPDHPAGGTIADVVPTVLMAHTVWRNAFDRAYTWGKSVLEMDPRDPKAVSEVLGIYREVMEAANG